MEGKLTFILSRKFLSNTLLICTNISGQNELDLWLMFVEILVLKKMYREILWSPEFNGCVLEAFVAMWGLEFGIHYVWMIW